MSDNIPFEIQVEIIKKAPDLKSLIRCRSVSKPWKSFIDTSDFIAGYVHRDTNTFLLRYKDGSNSNDKYLRFVDDDDNVPLKMKSELSWFHSLFVGVPDSMKQEFNDSAEVIGSSHGLVCLHIRNTGLFLLSNPCIRKVVSLRLPNYPFRDSFLGFAVCPVTNDPTIVMILSSWQVGIFTLSSKRFTFSEYPHLHPRRVQVMSSQVVIDRCIYWAASETILHNMNGDAFFHYGTFHYEYVIMSFDLVAKEIRLIDIPRNCTLNNQLPSRFFVSELRGSLVLFVPNEEVAIPVCGVWKMEHDESFTKLFTITTPGYTINNILGFRKNGDQVVLETEKEDEQFAAVQLYNPCSEYVNNLGIFGEKSSFFMASYKETLLLRDELDYFVCPPA